jgi:hypothetical protein
VSEGEAGETTGEAGNGTPTRQIDVGRRCKEWWWWRLLCGSAPANDEEGDDDPTGPITISPDPKKWRVRRSICRDGWWRTKWDEVFVPADPPERFATESLSDLAGKLKTPDEDVARAILAEAEAAYSEPQQVIDSAERRATTLQGTVAIAASVALAGGGFLLDPSRIEGRGLRIAIVVLLALFVVCLLGCAVRALGATVRIFNFEEPGFVRIGDRASMSNTEVLTHRAAELLRASAVADMVGSVKIGLLRSAAWWFRRALLLLALLTVLISAYAIWGTEKSTSHALVKSSKPTIYSKPTAPLKKPSRDATSG